MSSNRGNNDLVEKIKGVQWRALGRNISNKVKQYAMNLSPLEVQVEEATNLDTWGPHGSVMAEICEACFDPEGYRQVLGVIARRLQEKEERWRMAYKALLLLEYLIKHGPEKVWRDVQQSGSVLLRLTRFEYVDANQRDHGVNVRHRAQEIRDLVNNEGRVREERRKAAENKAKYSGYSASQMRMGAGGGGGGGSGGGGGRMTGFGSGGAGSRDAGYGRETSGFSSASKITTATSGSTSVSPSAKQRAHAGGDLAFGGLDEHEGPTLDPISATQARIAGMKIANRELHYDDPVEEETRTKKKLSDVRANPKIAASLGIKIAAPPSAKGASGKTINTGPAAGDLLVGTTASGGAGANADAWDPFGSGEAEVKSPEPVFDPFSVLDAKPAAQSAAPGPAADPFVVTPMSPAREEKKTNPDPFADLLL